MLIVDPSDRFSGQQCLEHAWFREFSGDVDPDDSVTQIDVLERLKSFKNVSNFKKTAMNMLIKTASDEEVKDLRVQF